MSRVGIFPSPGQTGYLLAGAWTVARALSLVALTAAFSPQIEMTGRGATLPVPNLRETN